MTQHQFSMTIHIYVNKACCNISYCLCVNGVGVWVTISLPRIMTALYKSAPRARRSQCRKLPGLVASIEQTGSAAKSAQ